MAIFRYVQQQRNLEDEVQMLVRISKKKTMRAKLFVMLWTEMLYMVWLQRNEKVFRGHVLSCDPVCRQILFRVACRAADSMRQLMIPAR
jgi:hypothetical protein